MKKRSVLLQLVRDSIQEVFEANRTIDKEGILKKYPLLNEHITSKVNLYIDGKLRGSYSSKDDSKNLLEDIIYNAKKAAFEDENFPPLTTSQYLSCEIELILNTPDGVMNEKDKPILKGDIPLEKVFGEDI